jgi:hypothetical protein
MVEGTVQHWNRSKMPHKSKDTHAYLISYSRRPSTGQWIIVAGGDFA